jgi:hypothetical protein
MKVNRVIPDYLLGALRQYKSNSISEVKEEFVFGFDIDEILVQLELQKLREVAELEKKLNKTVHKPFFSQEHYDEL